MPVADSLNVKIALDTAELTRGVNSARKSLQSLNKNTVSISNAMSKNFGSMVNSLKKVGAAIGSIVAAGQLVQFGKQAIDAASDLQEVQNVVDTVFGSMSGTINSWAKGAMDAFGLSETSAKRFTSTMGAMLKSSGITGNALQTMSINMAALSADMASFYNLSADTAFEKIRAGISGETEPLKQLGINMSVANLEAYALANGITKSYDAMTQAEQTILRYNYLLSVTGDAQHDFERTSGSWANQTRVLAENFNRLKTIIGEGLIAALTPLVQLLNTLIQRVIDFANAIKAAFGGGETTDSGGMSQPMQDTASSAATAADNIASANDEAKKLKNTIGGFDELNILSDDGTSSKSDSSSADSAVSGLQPTSVYDSIAQSTDEISEKILETVEKLKQGLQPIATLAGQIKQSFIDAFSGDNATRLTDELTRGFDAVLSLVSAVAEAMSEAWSINGDSFAQSISDALYEVMALVNTITEALAQAFQSEAGTEYFASLLSYATAFNDIIAGIASALNEALTRDDAGVEFFESWLSAAASVNNALAAIGETVANMWNSEVGVNFFSALISLGTTFNGIVSMIADTFTKAWTNAGLGQSIVDGIVQTITNLLQFVTALGKRFMEAWTNAGQGEATMSAILGAVDSIIQLVMRLSESWRNVWDSEATTKIFSGILSIIETIGNTIKTVGDNLRAAFENTGADTKVFTAIQTAIQGIVSAAQNLAGRLGAAFSGIDWEPIAEAAAMLATAISNVVQAVAGLAGNTLAAFGQAVAEAFNATAPTIIKATAVALQAIANIINRISPEGLIQLAMGITTVVAAMKGISAISKITSLITSFTGALGGSSATILIVATGIATLVAAITALVVAWTDLQKTMSNTSGLDAASNAVSSTNSTVSAASTASYRMVTTSDIPQLASGGTVRAGTLFIANERGPELVGSYGNQSAVMNNAQIVSAVSQGVAAAIQPLTETMAASNTKQAVRIRGNDLLMLSYKTIKQHGAMISTNFGFGGT